MFSRGIFGIVVFNCEQITPGEKLAQCCG